MEKIISFLNEAITVALIPFIIGIVVNNIVKIVNIRIKKEIYYLKGNKEKLKFKFSKNISEEKKYELIKKDVESIKILSKHIENIAKENKNITIERKTFNIIKSFNKENDMIKYLLILTNNMIKDKYQKYDILITNNNSENKNNDNKNIFYNNKNINNEEISESMKKAILS